MGALMDRQAQYRALHTVALATLETIGETGKEGAPAGAVFAAMQVHGATLQQFKEIVDPMTQYGLLRREGDCLWLTEAGEAFMVTLRGKRFKVQATVHNPSDCGHAAAKLVDFAPTESRVAAAGLVKTYHERGYWVEVLDSKSDEVLAGPFNPEEPLPGYII